MSYAASKVITTLMSGVALVHIRGDFNQGTVIIIPHTKLKKNIVLVKSAKIIISKWQLNVYIFHAGMLKMWLAN